MNRKQALRLWQIAQRMLFLQDRPLSAKLLVFLGLLVIVPLVVVGVISYVKSSAILQDGASRSSWQIMAQVKSHIEYYIRDFEIDSIRLMNQPDMRKLLTMDNAEEIESSGMKDRILQLFKDTAYSRPDLSRITLLLEGKAVIDTAGGDEGQALAALPHSEWYATVPMNGDIKLVSRVSQRRNRTENVISIAKRIIDPQTLEPAGMLIMDINFKRIEEIAYNVTVGRSGYMAILDEQGRYIYHPDPAMLGHKAAFRHIDWMLSKDNGYFQTGNEPFYTFNRSSYLNWYLISVMPAEELTRGVAYIGRTLSVTVLVTLFVAYLFAIGFAASIVAPIRKLQFFMKRVKEGDFAARAKVDSKDEIGRLANDFNGMVETVQVLMDEVYAARLREAELSLWQKEAELKLLQSQVNPHFLYNALETVRGMALERDMGDIAKLVSSLAKLLRYNLNNKSPVVSLKEELAICRMYLAIQKFRFEEKLSFAIDVPDWALSQEIVKFSLQPLVENSVIHGMEPGTAKVSITIGVSRISEESYALTIEDTGAGIPPERLRDIRLGLRHNDASMAGEHIGMLNVHRRIVHLCGEPYGLRVDSEPGQGTSVSVHLPLKEA